MVEIKVNNPKRILEKVESEIKDKKEAEKIGYSIKQLNEALEKFKEVNLLNNILEELSKTHLGDRNLKMTNFLVNTSGLLPNPKRRMSIALKGGTSVGKDNEIKTCLLHMPKETYIFLTSATQSTIEDDIKNKRIIAFSEVNAFREGGANKFLIEVIKQKTEGGTSSIKKDIRKGLKTARYEEGEQTTINYATTEAEKDEEMGTRFIEGHITINYDRIKIVNDNTLDTFSDLDRLLEDNSKKDSWIKIGLSYFYNQEEQFEIYLPFAKHLKEQINGEYIFDHSNPRSQRDIKRLLALTCATTYLFQLQREKTEHKGRKILVGEPQDLINTLYFTSKFFNQSYTGLDARLTEVIKVMEELGGEWVARDGIQEKLGITRNTIKKYCGILAEEGLIEGQKGVNLNEEEGVKIYHQNRFYYRRCQKGVKKPLIRCQLSKLRVFLEEKHKNNLTPFLFTQDSDDKNDEKRYQKKGVKLKENRENRERKEKNDEKRVILGDFDTFSLTPFRFTPIQPLNLGCYKRGQEIEVNLEPNKEYSNEDLGDLGKEMAQVLLKNKLIQLVDVQK